MVRRSISRTRSRSRRATPLVVVIGSINMDLVARVSHLPGRGETLAGAAFSTFPGGKGANQAVAVARLGARCVMVGRVGDDVFGRQLLGRLRAEGVDTRHVKVSPATSSGVAMIAVDDSGENSIVVVPGANGSLRPADIRAAEGVIARATVVLLQLEVPLNAAGEAIRLARRHEVPVVVDPAPVPADGLPDAFRGVDVLSPNQAEAAALTGVRSTTSADARRVTRILIERYDPGLVVLKLGENGAFADAGTGEYLRLPAYPVKVVDTTAAGDAFTAALTVRLAEDARLGDALRFAGAAGALACTRAGAQGAMPQRAAVEKFLNHEVAKVAKTRRRIK